MFFQLTPLIAAGENGAAGFRSGLPFTLLALLVIVIVHLVYSFARRTETPKRPSWNLWEKLVYWGTLLSVVVLGVTAFFAMLRYGVLDGWLLFFHMFGSGAFVAVLPLLALTWAGANRCGCCAEDASDGEGTAEKFAALPKAAFWVLLISGFVVTGTMLLSMLPLFGTDGLHTLLSIHRYSGLVAVVAVVLHLYGVILQRLGLR
jgi:cytochrome b subunit of formate dehydrogenase